MPLYNWEKGGSKNRYKIHKRIFKKEEINMKKRLIITESQMISLIEQYSNAEILFTPKR